MAFVLRKIISPTLQRHLAASRCAVTKSASDAAGAAEVKPMPKPSDDAGASGGDPKVLVSDSCIKRLREICHNGVFLRVTVEGGGCSGFQYKFDLDDKLNDDDRTFGDGDQAKVVIDNVSLEYCAGATVDYHTELIRCGFRMLGNPKAEQGCSCGASFAIKLD